MFTKKGQIALFVVLGVLILLIGGIVFTYLNSDLKTDVPEAVLDAASVENFAMSCLNKVLSEGARTVALRGGYVVPPSPSASWEANPVALYVVDGVDTAPSLETVQHELQYYVDTRLGECLDSFRSFPGLTIEAGRVSSLAFVDDTTVRADATMPIRITSGSSTKEIESLHATVSSPLGRLFSLSKGVVQEQLRHPTMVPASFLVDTALDNGVLFRLIDTGGGRYVVGFIDADASGEQAVFLFAIQLSAERSDAG